MSVTKERLKVVSIKEKEDPKADVISILEDFIKQLKSPDHPDPSFLIMFTDSGRATYNIRSVSEYIGCLELEKASFMSELEDELEAS